jgi:hypothetical protein
MMNFTLGILTNHQEKIHDIEAISQVEEASFNETEMNKTHRLFNDGGVSNPSASVAE